MIVDQNFTDLENETHSKVHLSNFVYLCFSHFRTKQNDGGDIEQLHFAAFHQKVDLINEPLVEGVLGMTFEPVAGRNRDLTVWDSYSRWVYLAAFCPPNKITNYRQSRGAIYILISPLCPRHMVCPCLLQNHQPHRILQPPPPGLSTFGLFFLLPFFRSCGLLSLSPLSISLTCAVATSLRIICLQRSTNASSTFALRLADVS